MSRHQIQSKGKMVDFIHIKKTSHTNPCTELSSNPKSTMFWILFNMFWLSSNKSSENMSRKKPWKIGSTTRSCLSFISTN